MYGLRRQGGWAGGVTIRVPYHWYVDEPGGEGVQRSLAALPSRQAQRLADQTGKPVRVDVANGNMTWTLVARYQPRKEV